MLCQCSYGCSRKGPWSPRHPAEHRACPLTEGDLESGKHCRCSRKVYESQRMCDRQPGEPGTCHTAEGLRGPMARGRPAHLLCSKGQVLAPHTPWLWDRGTAFAGLSGFCEHIRCTQFTPPTCSSGLPVPSGSHTHTDPVSGFSGNCAATPAIHRAVKTTVWGLGQVQEVAAPPWRALGGGHAFCNEEQLKLLAYY